MSEGRLWRQHDTGFSNNPDVQVLCNLKAEAVFIRAIDYVRRLGEIEQYKGCPDGAFSFGGLARDLGRIIDDDELTELLGALRDSGFLSELGAIESIKDEAWQISNYTKWNPSRTDLRSARIRSKAGSILGTHRRYHVKQAGYQLPPAPQLPPGQNPLLYGVDCLGCLVHLLHHKKKDIHKCSECDSGGMTDVIASYLNITDRADRAPNAAPPLPLGDYPPHAIEEKSKEEKSKEEKIKENAPAKIVSSPKRETTENRAAAEIWKEATNAIGSRAEPKPVDLERITEATTRGFTAAHIIEIARAAQADSTKTAIGLFRTRLSWLREQDPPTLPITHDNGCCDGTGLIGSDHGFLQCQGPVPAVSVTATIRPPATVYGSVPVSVDHTR